MSINSKKIYEGTKQYNFSKQNVDKGLPITDFKNLSKTSNICNESFIPLLW